MPSAVIVRAGLPAGLERLRRRFVDDAADGLPAHLTLLYPFAEREELTARIRRALAGIASRHTAFDYTLVGMASWPDAVYVAVAPVTPFVRLQRNLQAAFPQFPIYGRDATFEFVPHVTIAEGRSLGAAPREHRAWGALPRRRRAEAIEVIATDPGGRWRSVWRIQLGADGSAAAPAADRMRA